MVLPSASFIEHSTRTISAVDLTYYSVPTQSPESVTWLGAFVLAPHLLRSQRYTDLGAVGPAVGLGDPGAGCGQGVQVDAGFDTVAVEQVDHVLACHVAGVTLVAIESGQPPISGWPAPPPPWSGWAARWPG